MKGIFTRRNIWIASIVGVIAIAAIIVAFATGNTTYPGLSNPDDVFYQRLDDQGNVIYTITNEELFDEVKSNDGLNQILYLTDTYLLSEYIDAVTDTQIDDKLNELIYGTADVDAIAEYTDDQRASLERSFAQQMALAGFTGNEREYTRLMVARDEFAKVYADENGVITNTSIIGNYIGNYYQDVQAVKIRFTSIEDAEAVMQKYNLVSIAGVDLRTYNGFIFENETLLDGDGDDAEIVEAMEVATVYYFDEAQNIVDLEDNIIYSYGSGTLYTDSDDVQYQLDAITGNLIDGDLEIVVAAERLFDTKAEAETYQDENTFYYTVSRVDPFDMNETINVKNSENQIVYTIDSEGHIFDALNNDVTYSNTDLVINKVYTEIENVEIVTSNNSTELTNEEVLEYYIEMYNYVYGQYRTNLTPGSTVEELIASENEDLLFNYDELLEQNQEVANYIFKTLEVADDSDQYSNEPVRLSDTTDAYYYMVFKLTQPEKENFIDEIFEDVSATIVLPESLSANYTLPTTTYYNGTIAWSSEDATIISSSGVVNNPETDTNIKLTYTMSIFGTTKVYNVNVMIKAEEGENEDVEQPTYTEKSLEELLKNKNNTLQDDMYNELLDDYIYGANGASNVDSALSAKRAELGFQIYDRYLELDYLAVSPGYESNNNGHKTLIASFDKTLNGEDPYEITADQLYAYVVNSNAGLHVLNASQDKELLASTYYTTIYGEQTDVSKNNTEAMDRMYLQVQNVKSQYSYYQQLYAQMGSSFGYDSFGDFTYAQYGVKTEYGLLQYFVSLSLQAHLIQETVDEYAVIDALYDTVQEYYDNYFDMFVSHVLIHLDLDEDGDPDDYFEYEASLEGQDLIDFNALVAALENEIDLYEGSFTELVDEYNKASREDETWGAYKQAGFFIISQDLNYTDSDSGTTSSRTYVGTNTGVKDQFVPEFTQALVDLYQEYSNELNVDKDEMISDVVYTEFGIHLIKVTKGADFERPSTSFEEEDPANPKYSEGLVNEGDAPTLAQMKVYAQYTYYSMVYDLSDEEIEAKYNITIPNIPSDLEDALHVYFSELLSSIYVVGTVNISMADRVVNGEFLDTTYSELSNADFMAQLNGIADVYFDAILGDYITAE